MALSPVFPLRPARRRGVSELFAAVLMIGVTLSLGGLVAAGAVSQFSLGTQSASLGAAAVQRSAGAQLSLAFAAVPQSASCPSYRGAEEGTTLLVGLFDYGSVPFDPAGFAVNSTVYTGTFGLVAAGGLAQLAIPLGTCAHRSGQTVVAFDAVGDEVQLET